MSDGPVCIVLGGSGTVGRAVCRTLEAGGARVGLTYHRNRPSDNGAMARPVDLCDVGAIDRTLTGFADHFGRLDAVIHCAAVAEAEHHSMTDVDESAWDAMLAVNTKSAFFAARRASELMRERGGNIVLLGSIDGVKAAPSPVHYAASKGALAGMVKAMAKELGPHNIRVNTIAPGLVRTDFAKALWENPKIYEQTVRIYPLKRIGEPDEIAGAAVFLASPAGTFITGQTIVIDGGGMVGRGG